MTGEDSAPRVIRLTHEDLDRAAPLAAAFRVALRSYRGVSSKPNVDAAREELSEYLAAGWPMFAAEEGDVLAGYMVCRIEEPCVWVESLFVDEAHRRRRVASRLFEKAEALARERGEDTVYNYVHPNNDGMIAFLRARGYTVLNLIEIRKPWAGEALTRKIRVERNEFDY